MDKLLTEEDRAFREEVRQFLRRAVPADVARRIRQGFHVGRTDMQFWARTLDARGWAVPHWPREYGGPGWGPLRRYLFEQECTLADAPPFSWFGPRLVGPVIYTFGSPAQKQRYLPSIRNGDTFWCQGFSEPGSGSDLASLKTSAIRKGDHYLVNGQKLWTTEAHFADMGFFLVRTNPGVRIQEGISFLLIDMKSPGITVRPVITIDEGHSTNEVFLDNVMAPVENLVGEENKGWTYAKFLLGNERTSNAEIHRSKHDLEVVKEIARRERSEGMRMIDRAEFRRKLAAVEIEVHALEWSVLRILMDETGENLTPKASALKLRGSELQQRIAELTLEALGSKALRLFREPAATGFPRVQSERWPEYVPGKTAGYLYRRACSIYAGTNEIQRNVIAKLALGL